ncbi:MAG: ATP-binding protein [Bacteroidota bacterium]
MATDSTSELARLQKRVAALERQLASEEAHVRYFVRQAPVSVAMFDRQMNYLEASDQYRMDYKLEDTKIIGRNHYRLFKDVPDRWKAVHQRCLRGVEESCLGDKYVRSDGRIFYLDWVVKPWYNDQQEIGGLLLFADKVNDRIQGQRKLLELNEELRTSNQRLEELCFAISHLLTAPLEGNLRYLADLRTRLPEQEASATWEKEMDYITANTHRIRNLLVSLMSHISPWQEEVLREVELDRIIETVQQNLKPIWEPKQIQWHIGVLPQIQANELEMLALFQNLIANAVTYHDKPAGEVLVVAEKQADVWQFCVRDNGPGIPAEQQVDIFSLRRTLELDLRYEGTGIGLPICRRIVEYMKGKIWLTSQKGEGTAIYFTLPIQEKK